MKLKLLKSTSIVAFFTMLSRLLGFVRDVVFAQFFGAGMAFDAFVIAFKIPNFLRRLFAEGAFSQAFVPVLSDYRANQSHREVRTLIAHVSANLTFIAALVVVLAQLIAPSIVLLFAPGFHSDPARFALTTQMLHITFPYLLFITLVALSGAVLNTYLRFSMPALAPVMLNISLIVVALWWAPRTSTPIMTLCFGVLIGGVLQLLIQLPSLWRLDCLLWPRINWRHPGVRRILALMIPALFGVSVAQIGLLVDNFFASFLPTGSISWLYYSDRLTYLPLGVIGVALSTVVMPHLSRHCAQKDEQLYQKTLDWALRMVVLIGLPASVGLSLLSGPLLVTLIHHGAFNVHDVMMTQQSLVAFSVGLLAFMLIKVLASAFYAREAIRLPVKIAAVALLCNIALNLLLVGSLRHAGLALATALAAWINAMLLLFFLHRQSWYRPTPGWARLLLALIVSASVMAIFLYTQQGALTLWLSYTLAKAVMHLVYMIMMAIVVYIICLYIFGIRWRMFNPDA